MITDQKRYQHPVTSAIYPCKTDPTKFEATIYSGRTKWFTGVYGDVETANARILYWLNAIQQENEQRTKEDYKCKT